MTNRCTPLTERVWCRGLVWVLAIWLPLSSAGCSRPFWRDQAERDSYEAISENLTDPRWAVPRIDITPDPRSRFYSPYDPDYEPLPPDDPQAHVYMHWVDGWNGYESWHSFGDSMSVENPQWLAPFGLRAEAYDEETGEYLQPLPQIDELTLCQALELALIHNREYQTQIEIVFLRALEVTAERYQFAVRYLANGRLPGVDSTTTFRPDGGTDTSVLSSNIGVGQLLPTGGQWFLELVNNTIWLFDGPNQTQTASTLAFSLTQPLLLQAGRKVVLENLTQSERNLLYAVRDLARFRRQFFTDVVGGGNGYLSLLRQVQEIRNTEANIFRLEEQVEILKENSSRRPEREREALAALPPELAEQQLPESVRELIEYKGGELIWLGPMTEEQRDLLLGLSEDPAYRRAVTQIADRLLSETETVILDVLQLQSRLASTITALRSQQQGLQDSLDIFKFDQLGLRTDFLVTLDDTLLEQFQFLDESMIDLEREVKVFAPFWGQLDFDDPDPDQLRVVAERFSEILDDVEEFGLGLIRQDFGRLESIYEDRLASMQTDSERERLEYDVARDRRLYDDTVFSIQTLREKTEDFLSQLEMSNLSLEQRKQLRYDIKDNQEKLQTFIGTLQAVQIGLRVELVTTQDFDMSMEEAVAIALENRLDLKNQRAIVMDARRRVEVAANALQSNLDLVVEGEMNTPGPPGNTNPFEFRGDISALRAGVSFDAPLDLNNERNIYRAALIDYQRAKRDYMLLEDRVKQQVRADWRQMEVLKRNLETARQSTRIAAAQFDSTVSEAYAPKGVGGGRASVPGLSGQNILQALNSVLSAQNNMIRFWVGYEQNRLNIFRDMGIMEVGPDNVWNDPFYRELCGGPSDCPPEDIAPPAELATPLGAGVVNPSSLDSPPQDTTDLDGPELEPIHDEGIERLDDSAQHDDPLPGGEVWSLDRAVGDLDRPDGDDRGSSLRDAGDQGPIRRVGWKRILPFGH
ncbi:MAG: TolC family protein [Planctomycetaceae bacterium]|nr:TolC family protein [Planctomycetaceae bacterium]